MESFTYNTCCYIFLIFSNPHVTGSWTFLSRFVLDTDEPLSEMSEQNFQLSLGKRENAAAERTPGPAEEGTCFDIYKSCQHQQVISCLWTWVPVAAK